MSNNSSLSSSSPSKIGLFIFHRDFRIVDNVGFSMALTECDIIYPCFIFTPEQIGSQNKYRSFPCIQFMIESLIDLDKSIRENSNDKGSLICVYGNPITKTRELVNATGATHVYFNCDYTPYAKQRDMDTKKLLDKMDVSCNMAHDYLLYEPNTILTSTRKPYQKFTPFYEAIMRSSKHPSNPMRKHTGDMYRKIRDKNVAGRLSVSGLMNHFIGKTKYNENAHVHGGREEGIRRMANALRTQSHYETKRDELTYETTFLSAYLKFGCISIRELYDGVVSKYGKRSGLLREILWREFFMHVLYGYPEVLDGAFIEKYRNINWRKSVADFNKWKEGKTGVPIVDACMRQMNETGYMHNRGRMIVATFLTKTLLLNWRLGEMYFAQKLIDYDPASNNGNWQSIASTGVDMKPYYRDMNPYIQSAKFDKNAEYIKKWLPELAEVDARSIHKWETEYEKELNKGIKYFAPMVIYAEQKEKMLDMYKHV